MARKDWKFSDYIEEIVLLCEISEIPGMADKRAQLISEAWQRFPAECEELGLVGQPEEHA